MAQNETWINHDLMSAVKVQYLDGNVFSQDNAGNLIGVHLTRGGADYSGGGTVSANVIRADGATVAVSGALSGANATVVLPSAAYAVPGVISIVVKLTASGEITTIAAVVANVYQSSTDTVVDPGTIIPSIEDLIDEIEAAVASIPADYSSLWTALAHEFNASKSGGYVVGDYVTYNGNLYRFKNAHTGTWDANDVVAANVGNAITALDTTIKPLLLMTHATRTDQFSISSVADGNNNFTYTITTRATDVLYGCSEYDVGTKYGIYVFSYEQGCGNVGTSEWNYKFDDTIVSSSINGFAAFVADKSDYTLKIINVSKLTVNQRVIAMFYGRPENLESSFEGFGVNDDLFMMKRRSFSKFVVANLQRGYYGSLTWAKDADNVYTITKNNSFWAFGVNEKSCTQIGIGDSGVAGINYPFPDSVSSEGSISEFAAIVADLKNTTTSTWKIIPISDLRKNTYRYGVLGFIYNNIGVFFSELTECLFSNAVDSGDYYKRELVADRAFWYSAICNSIAVISGKVVFNPANYTIEFRDVIIAPNAVPGQYTIKSGTITLDWSDEEHPSYIRAIYYNNVTATFVAYSVDNTADAATALAARKAKEYLYLVCMVYRGNYVYTCGSAQPGIWYVNNRDVYGNVSSNVDLYKAFRRVAVIGDSLSVGYMYNKATGVATSRMLQYSWVKQVMNDAGVPWLNLGTSGQNVLTWCSNATYGKVQAEASGNKCQAYVIGLGENDQSDSVRGIPLGTSSDIVDNYQTVATTYYGGYARIIQILKHLNPDCKIFCLTNPVTGGQRAAYNDAVRYIAETYYDTSDNVYLVDLAANDASAFNSGFLPADRSAAQGGHYSAIGYARVATIMEEAITNAIDANQADFVNIAYIPYDTTDPTPDTMTE